MSRLVRAELLKLRTTRLVFWLALLVLLLEVLVISLHVGQDSPSSLARRGTQRDVISVAAVSVLVGLVLGIVASTGEWAHGTVSHTFLVAPLRERVVAAKLIAVAAVGAAIAVLAGAFAWLFAALLLSSRSVPVHLASLGVMRPLFGTVLAAAIAGALGVGFGFLLRRQTAAIVIAFVWLLIVEPLLAIVDGERYAPAHALAAVVEQGSTVLRFWPGLALSLVYAGAFAAVGATVVKGTDVS